jgi:hypothetical protein
VVTRAEAALTWAFVTPASRRGADAAFKSVEVTEKTTERHLLGSEASLLLMDPRTWELTFRVSTDLRNVQLKAVSLKPGQGIAGWVAKEGRPLEVGG